MNPAVGCHYFPPCPQLPSQALEGCYQFRCLVNRGAMGVNSLPKTVTRERRGCDLNPSPSAPESTRLPSHPKGYKNNTARDTTRMNHVECAKIGDGNARRSVSDVGLLTAVSTAAIRSLTMTSVVMTSPLLVVILSSGARTAYSSSLYLVSLCSGFTSRSASFSRPHAF